MFRFYWLRLWPKWSTGSPPGSLRQGATGQDGRREFESRRDRRKLRNRIITDNKKQRSRREILIHVEERLFFILKIYAEVGFSKSDLSLIRRIISAHPNHLPFFLRLGQWFSTWGTRSTLGACSDFLWVARTSQRPSFQINSCFQWWIAINDSGQEVCFRKK